MSATALWRSRSDVYAICIGIQRVLCECVGGGEHSHHPGARPYWLNQSAAKVHRGYCIAAYRHLFSIISEMPSDFGEIACFNRVFSLEPNWKLAGGDWSSDSNFSSLSFSFHLNCCHVAVYDWCPMMRRVWKRRTSWNSYFVCCDRKSLLQRLNLQFYFYLCAHKPISIIPLNGRKCFTLNAVIDSHTNNVETKMKYKKSSRIIDAATHRLRVFLAYLFCCNLFAQSLDE